MSNIPKENIFHSNKLYSSGIRALDQRLGSELEEDSGFPDSSLVIIHVPPNTDLGILFTQKVLINLIQNYENSIGYYFHSSKPSTTLLKGLNTYDWGVKPLIQENRLELIDMWAITSSHVASSSKIGKIDIKRKTFLKQEYKRMLRIKETKNLTCFSIVDNLLWLKEENLDQNPSKTLEFIKELIALIYNIGGVHFFILPKGVINEVSERIVTNFATGLIDFETEFRGNSLKNLFYISKMTGISLESEILEINPSRDGGFRIESTSKI